MADNENFEIDTAQPATTAVPVTDEVASVEDIDTADGPISDETDPRPVWDIEYRLGDGGGVVEIHANTAMEARTAFEAQQPKAEILSIEPG